MGFLLFLTAAIILFPFVCVIWLLIRTGELRNELEKLTHIVQNSGFQKTDTFKKADTIESLVEKPDTGDFTNTVPIESETPFLLQDTMEILTKASVSQTIKAEAEPDFSSEPLVDFIEQDSIVPSPDISTESKQGTVAAFIRGGNYWAAAGVLLLIAGFALLMTYIVRRGFFTVEMRIAVAAISGLCMVSLGWFLRKRRPLYFLILQGGGIGVLYLTVFAAHKLTNYVPLESAMVLMSILVPAAVVIAIFQNAQVLAFFGFLGGFAAPILLSGGGRFVFLLAYYTALSLGILIIVFFRSWKLTALLGFLSSFGVPLYWLFTAFQREDLALTEPFLAVFVVIYTTLGIKLLYRTEQKYQLQNKSSYAEWMIILGTPILGVVSHWKAFSHFKSGYALVSLAFAVFYLILSFGLLKKKLPSVPKVLIEGYGALALLLANIIVPLELSGAQICAVWAAESVVVYFLGLRRNDIRILIAAFLIHTAAAICFIIERPSLVYGPFRSTAFWGMLIIAASALIMVVLSKKAAKKNAPAFLSKNGFLIPVFLWALVWYFTGLGTELWRICQNRSDFFAWYFTAVSGSALLFFLLSKIFDIRHFMIAVLPSLVFAFFAMVVPFYERLTDFIFYKSSNLFTNNYFHGPWLWAWLAFFLIQLILIIFSRKSVPDHFHVSWLFSACLIVLPVLTFSLRYLTIFLYLSPSWTAFAGIMPLVFSLLLLSILFKRISCGSKSLRIFIGAILPWILCGVAALWFTVTLFMTGDPAPLPVYIPFLNPLELLEALCVTVIIISQLRANRTGLPAMNKKAVVIVADIMVFIWITAMLARIVHFFGGIPYRNTISTDAWRFSLFVFWALWGIGHIIAGHRFALRPMWIAGAILTAADLVKLLLLDLANTGMPVRIASFFIGGLVLLFIGWAAPLPPALKREVTS